MAETLEELKAKTAEKAARVASVKQEVIQAMNEGKNTDSAKISLERALESVEFAEGALNKVFEDLESDSIDINEMLKKSEMRLEVSDKSLKSSLEYMQAAMERNADPSKGRYDIFGSGLNLDVENHDSIKEDVNHDKSEFLDIDFTADDVDNNSSTSGSSDNSASDASVSHGTEEVNLTQEEIDELFRRGIVTDENVEETTTAATNDTATEKAAMLNNIKEYLDKSGKNLYNHNYDLSKLSEKIVYNVRDGSMLETLEKLNGKREQYYKSIEAYRTLRNASDKMLDKMQNGKENEITDEEIQDIQSRLTEYQNLVNQAETGWEDLYNEGNKSYNDFTAKFEKDETPSASDSGSGQPAGSTGAANNVEAATETVTENLTIQQKAQRALDNANRALQSMEAERNNLYNDMTSDEYDHQIAQIESAITDARNAVTRARSAVAMANNIDMRNGFENNAEQIEDVENFISSATNLTNTATSNFNTIKDEIKNPVQATTAEVSGAQGTSLMSKFRKYFIGDKPQNLLYSIDFAKSVLRHFTPGRDIPENPKELLDSAKDLFDNEFKNQSYNDEKFVRFLVDKVNKEPGLMSYDMIADLVESDTYKKFGTTNKDDLKDKSKFEKWVLNKSMLSKIDKMPAVDVVIGEEGMTRVVEAIGSDKLKAKYKEQIANKVAEFDETYVDHLDEKKLNEIKELINKESSSNEEHKEKIARVYKTLCKDPNMGEIFREALNTTYLGTDVKGRAPVLLGYQTALNKCLDATCKRINQKDQFKQQGIQINNSSEFMVDPCHQPEVEKGPNRLMSGGEMFKDCALTLVKTSLGAAGISAIASISGFGPIARGVIGISSVVSAGIAAAKVEYDKAKTKGNGVVSKRELLGIGLKSGISMVKKTVPQIAAIAFDNSAVGLAFRGVAALTVAAKTLYKDLEAAAGLGKVQSEFTNTVKRKTGLMGKFERGVNLLKNLKENWIGAKGKGRGKAIAHALGKGAAMFGGGSLGAELGGLAGGAGENSIENEELIDSTIETNTNGEMHGPNLPGMEEQGSVSPVMPGAELPTQEPGLEAEISSGTGADSVQSVDNGNLTPGQQYLRDNPNAMVDKNGWIYEVNENGQPVYVKDANGTMLAEDYKTAVYRDPIEGKEWVNPATKNIEDLPKSSWISENTQQNFNNPGNMQSNEVTRNEATTEPASEFENRIHENRYNRLAANQNAKLDKFDEKMNAKISQIENPTIREALSDSQSEFMAQTRVNLGNEYDAISHDGKVEVKEIVESQRDLRSALAARRAAIEQYLPNDMGMER